MAHCELVVHMNYAKCAKMLEHQIKILLTWQTPLSKECGKDLQREIMPLLNPHLPNCAVAQFLTRPCQTTPYKSSMIVGPRTRSKYVESLCSSRVTDKMCEVSQAHSICVVQIRSWEGDAQSPWNCRINSVAQNWQCKSFGVFWIQVSASATAGRKSMPEFSGMTNAGAASQRISTQTFHHP